MFKSPKHTEHVLTRFLCILETEQIHTTDDDDDNDDEAHVFFFTIFTVTSVMTTRFPGVFPPLPIQNTLQHDVVVRYVVICFQFRGRWN